MNDPGRNELWGRCQDCRHRWLVLRAPIDLMEFSHTLRKTTCPNCGVGFERLETAKPPDSEGDSE